jgi:hypothetical protein
MLNAAADTNTGSPSSEQGAPLFLSQALLRVFDILSFATRLVGK